MSPAGQDRADEVAGTVLDIVADMTGRDRGALGLDDDLRARLGAGEDDLNALAVVVSAEFDIDLEGGEVPDTVADLVAEVRRRAAEGDGSADSPLQPLLRGLETARAAAGV